MKKVFFFLVPVFVFADALSSLSTRCESGSSDACARVGIAKMNPSSPDYDPTSAVYYLELGCDSKSGKSCYALSQYYVSKGQDYRSKYYLNRGCDLGDRASCYFLNRGR